MFRKLAFLTKFCNICTAVEIFPRKRRSNFTKTNMDLNSVQFILYTVFNNWGFFLILSYSILFFLFLSYSLLFYLILSYSILFYLIISYSTVSYSILFFLILSYSFLFFLILSYSILFFGLSFVFSL